MNTEPRSSHRCPACASYLEIVFQDATKVLAICPVCERGLVVIPVAVTVKEPKR
jgi:hypothetical protein